MRPGVTVGHELPRLWTRPIRPLTPATSSGFECIEFAEQVLGLQLLPWQRWLLIHLLELNPDNTYRFRTAVVMVARQNGKSTLLQIIALWKLYLDGANLIIGTAQNLDIAEETWAGAVELAESVPELREEIAHVDRTNGKKALRLTAGERYKVAAASRRGGRGLSGDFIALDELREHQNWDAWAAVTKTTMARERPQIVGFSNAGTAESVVLASLRNDAMATIGERYGLWDGAGDDSLGIFEWSPSDDTVCTCRHRPHQPECLLQDRSRWAAANPALGHTITERAISSAMSTDPDPIFLTEVLCRWVDGVFEPVIPLHAWAAAEDPTSTIRDGYQVALAVDVAYPDRDMAAISVCGMRDDGDLHVEVIAHRPGTDWVVRELVRLRDKWWPSAIVIDPGGPAGSLLNEAEEAELDIVQPSTREIAQGCGEFYDLLVDSKRLHHLGQKELNDALTSAAKRDLSDAWAWSRKGSRDISPLVSATNAVWAHQKYAYLAAGTAEAIVL